MRRIRVKPVGEKPQLWNWAKLAAKLCVNSGLVKPFLRLLAGNSSTSKPKITKLFEFNLVVFFFPEQRMSIIQFQILTQNEKESISVSLNFVNLYSSCILTPLNSHNFLFHYQNHFTWLSWFLYVNIFSRFSTITHSYKPCKAILDPHSFPVIQLKSISVYLPFKREILHGHCSSTADAD